MNGRTLALLEDAHGRPGPGVHLAVFGKHPCAADHLEDLGMTSASLVAFKQMFYVDGIGGNLATSRWREPAPGQGLPWNHWILCAGPQGFLLARCGAGCDSRGRKQYPLVLAAHVAHPSWIDQAARLDFLAGAAAALHQESTREGLERVRQENLSRLRDWSLDEIPATAARRRFAAADSGAPGLTGILRALHALHHGGQRPSVRLPSCGQPLASAVLWAGLIRSVLPRFRVVTIAAADDRPEVLEGSATPPDATAIRPLFPQPPPDGGAAARPALTTEVEFALAPEFESGARAAIDAWIDGAPAAPPAADAGLLNRLSRLFRR